MEALLVHFPWILVAMSPLGFWRTLRPIPPASVLSPRAPFITICLSHVQQPLGSLSLWLCDKKCLNHQPLTKNRRIGKYLMLHSRELMSNKCMTFSIPKTWTQNLTKIWAWSLTREQRIWNHDCSRNSGMNDPDKEILELFRGSCQGHQQLHVTFLSPVNWGEKKAQSLHS